MGRGNRGVFDRLDKYLNQNEIVHNNGWSILNPSSVYHYSLFITQYINKLTVLKCNKSRYIMR